MDYECCPICYKLISTLEINEHTNKCIFLNDTHQEKFTSSSNCNETDQFATPLSEQMKPKSLNDFYGQNSLFRSLLEGIDIPNMLLWGPPGCGKTSLANIIGEICKKNSDKYRYMTLNAVDCSYKAIQNVKSSDKRQLVLFVDEIHQLKRQQQNVVLQYITDSKLTLIGATTENPSFVFSNLFLNSCKVIVMNKLEISDIFAIVKRTLSVLKIKIIDDHNSIRNYFLSDDVRIHESAVNWLAETTDGDARIALNNLQLILQHNKGKKLITIDNVKDGIKKSHLLYDRTGEEHHNIISAMHESIKGYNDNAALYWTARMMEGGEDRSFIARRLVRAASEDTENADPKALQLAVTTMLGCQSLRIPESDTLLAQCAIYLARAPTKKETQSALTLAKQMILKCKNQQPVVPIYLSKAPDKLITELGYGNSMSFMPAGLENVKFL